MARQYGQLSREEEERQRTAGYRKAEPKVKPEDPSPPTKVVEDFHKNVALDTRPEDKHHTLGLSPNQASPGNHTHNGSDSPLLLDGIVLTGSKGGNAALLSVISALVRLGARDATT